MIKIKKVNFYENEDPEIGKFLKNIVVFDPYEHTNHMHEELINYIKINAEIQFNPIEYQNESVLYAFILPFTTNPNNIIIKFGHSNNIMNKIKSMKSSDLIALRIMSSDNAKDFFKILKIWYSKLSYTCNNCYKFHPMLLKEYKCYVCK